VTASLSLALAAGASAAPPERNNGTDPTRPRQMLEPLYRFENLPGAAPDSQNTFLVRGQGWASLDEHWSGSLRVDVPLVLTNAESSQNPAGRFVFGSGDVLTQLAVIYTVDDLWAAAAGSQLTFPTASRDDTGSGTYGALPALVVRRMLAELSDGSFFAPEVLYQLDYGGGRRLRLGCAPRERRRIGAVLHPGGGIDAAQSAHGAETATLPRSRTFSPSTLPSKVEEAGAQPFASTTRPGASTTSPGVGIAASSILTGSPCPTAWSTTSASGAMPSRWHPPSRTGPATFTRSSASGSVSSSTPAKSAVDVRAVAQALDEPELGVRGTGEQDQERHDEPQHARQIATSRGPPASSEMRCAPRFEPVRCGEGRSGLAGARHGAGDYAARFGG
jgi:hypothetical protein